jgi:hypothetical protein
MFVAFFSDLPFQVIVSGRGKLKVKVDSKLLVATQALQDKVVEIVLIKLLKKLFRFCQGILSFALGHLILSLMPDPG